MTVCGCCSIGCGCREDIMPEELSWGDCKFVLLSWLPAVDDGRGWTFASDIGISRGLFQ